MSDPHAHHDHSHHDHDHNGHHHHAPKVDDNNRRRVGLAALLTGLFVIIEVAGGLISGSLALLADAGHMLTDFAALVMAWGAFMIARRPADPRYTFGYDRVAILVAFVNGLTLFVLALWIVFEAIMRLRAPGEVLSGPMLAVAIAGLIVNLIVFWILRGADQHNLNVRGAMLHVLGDLLGSVAAILAALIIMQTGWTAADPILSVLVAILILRSAWGLMKASAHVLLEGTPAGIDTAEIATDLIAEIPELISVEHIHAWSITPERPMLSLDAYIEPSARIEPVNLAIKSRLADRFNINHASVDVMRHQDSYIPDSGE